MTTVEAMNALAKELAHGHALSCVPEGMCSIWQLQAEWLKEGTRRNLAQYAAGRPEFAGLTGWREGELVPPEIHRFTWTSGSVHGLYHVTGTGRMRVFACEHYQHPRRLDQVLGIELWSGSPYPRMLVRVRGTSTVHLREDGQHVAEGVQFRLVEDKTREEDRGERLDRLYYLWWLDQNLGHVTDAEELLPLLAARAETLARAREAEAEGIPVTVVAAEGVRRGTLRGNTITVSGEASNDTA